MENFKGDFYKPENQAEFNGFDGEYLDISEDDFGDPYDDSGSELEYDDEPIYDDDGGDFEFDDDDPHDDDDSEFLGGVIGGIAAPLAGLAAPLVTSGVGAAIRGVSGLLRGTLRNKGRRLSSRRYTSGGPRVARNIATAIKSNLFGKIRTRSGRSVSFKLPPNVATKRDVISLKKGIKTNANAIRSNTKGVKANAKSILTTSSSLSKVDKKHTAASQTQNRILSAVNRRVRKVQKDFEAAQEQQRMMQMFQFMMPPEIENITFAEDPKKDDEAEVTSVEFKQNFLPMMMAMGQGGGMGDMMNNPMMMFVMMEAFKEND